MRFPRLVAKEQFSSGAEPVCTAIHGQLATSVVFFT